MRWEGFELVTKIKMLFIYRVHYNTGGIPTNYKGEVITIDKVLLISLCCERAFAFYRSMTKPPCACTVSVCLRTSLKEALPTVRRCLRHANIIRDLPLLSLRGLRSMTHFRLKVRCKEPHGFQCHEGDESWGRDALSPQNPEISLEFSEFPDFHGDTTSPPRGSHRSLHCDTNVCGAICMCLLRSVITLSVHRDPLVHKTKYATLFTIGLFFVS